MLTTLRISGLAVVDQVEVRFGPGLNVLTGETGAGKSLLVSALHLVLGGRASADLLREGAEEASVEALFELPPEHPVFARLEAAGAPPGAGAGELLVRRTVSRGGRGRAFVNGSLLTASMLEQAMRGLVDVSGQHEHVSLLDPATHLALLDAFGGLAGAGGLGARYREAQRELAARVRERDALRAEEGERARRADYLAFQLRELDAADPRPGEDEELERERRVLASSEKLREAARAAEGLVYGEEGSASERVGRAARALAEAAHTDPRLEGPLGLLRSAAAEAEEAGRELQRYADSLGGDPERLARVEERLELLRQLARKHGGSLAAAATRREAMREELAAASGSGERLEALEREIAEWGPRAGGLAGELSAARRRAGSAFCRAVQQELEALAMGRCRLELAFLPPEGGVEQGGLRLGPDGAERGEILLAPNPGEPPRALARIASGGELSRVMLAVKRASMRSDPVPTYVFDEVDAGIGGAVAESVGRLLAEVARGRQVICVTHLPQVAAFAERQHRVEKRVAGGRTSARVELLEGEDDRRREVARMLAGQTVTESALEHAGALIAAARATAPPRERRPASPRGVREART
ncbi:MAG TPA: DNA repair protein RecN [Anaeromyxobacteraceae bacterium]|nr:DNA repair protein RecN [Anaeromyxobacteraceae bacterium]